MFRNKRTLLFVFCLLCLIGWGYVFVSYYSVHLFYKNSIEEVRFETVEFEKDTSYSTIDSSTHHNLRKQHPDRAHIFQSDSDNVQAPSFNNGMQASIQSFAEVVDATHRLLKKEDLPKSGTALTSNRFNINYKLNTRWRMTNFMNAFEEGDYISGKELSRLFKKDPTINKLVKSTLCGFIENNIDRITRINNALVIHTKNEKGIHTKIKIPFVENVKIDIENGSAIYIGQTFLSREPLFKKSYLMPVALKDINILHNGEPFPKSGFISGDYYFIDYAQTKTAYKIK